MVTLANWAHEQGYRLRARGKGHTWSPLVVPAGADTSRTIIVDTTFHRTAVSVRGGNPGSVTAQARAALDSILTRLEEAGSASPRPLRPATSPSAGCSPSVAMAPGCPPAANTRPRAPASAP
ncbi:hypothetical protein ACWGQL_31310 [Streptomyces lydicus]